MRTDQDVLQDTRCSQEYVTDPQANTHFEGSATIRRAKKFSQNLNLTFRRGSQSFKANLLEGTANPGHNPENILKDTMNNEFLSVHGCIIKSGAEESNHDRHDRIIRALRNLKIRNEQNHTQPKADSRRQAADIPGMLAAIRDTEALLYGLQIYTAVEFDDVATSAVSGYDATFNTRKTLSDNNLDDESGNVKQLEDRITRLSNGVDELLGSLIDAHERVLELETHTEIDSKDKPTSHACDQEDGRENGCMKGGNPLSSQNTVPHQRAKASQRVRIPNISWEEINPPKQAQLSQTLGEEITRPQQAQFLGRFREETIPPHPDTRTIVCDEAQQEGTIQGNDSNSLEFKTINGLIMDKLDSCLLPCLIARG